MLTQGRSREASLGEVSILDLEGPRPQKPKPCKTCNTQERYANGCCIQCKHVWNRDFYLKNRESEDERHKRWLRENAEKRKAIRRRYYASHRELYKKAKHKWWEANKERCREYGRLWAQRNRDKKAAYNRRYRERQKALKAGGGPVNPLPLPGQVQ